jgi:precorrin-6B methylase 2
MRATGNDGKALKSAISELPPNSRILEVGTGNGGSAVFFIGRENVDEVITIDSFDSGDTANWAGVKSHAEQTLKDYPQIRLIPFSSKVVFKGKKRFGPSLKDFDLIYIDGDHRYEAVKFDIEAWQTRLKPDGVLVGHDYYKNVRFVPRNVVHVVGVTRAVHETLPEYWVSRDWQSSVWSHKKIGDLNIRMVNGKRKPL